MKEKTNDLSENMESNKKKDTSGSGIGIGIGMSVLFILLGLLLIFVPEITITDICYALCGILVAIGIFLIVRYFLTEAYRNLKQYGFSSGALLVILGMCALVKVDSIAASFFTCLGILILITAVIALQNALDLFALKTKIWPIWLIFAAGFTVCSIIVILNPFGGKWDLNYFTYIVLVADGAISLLSTLFLFIRIRSFEKKETMNEVSFAGENSETESNSKNQQEENYEEEITFEDEVSNKHNEASKPEEDTY